MVVESCLEIVVSKVRCGKARPDNSSGPTLSGEAFTLKSRWLSNLAPDAPASGELTAAASTGTDVKITDGR